MSEKIGVKEAMQNFIAVIPTNNLEGEEPANTIKKLTKQMLTAFCGENEEIDNARTIADAYQAAAKAMEQRWRG